MDEDEIEDGRDEDEDEDTADGFTEHSFGSVEHGCWQGVRGECLDVQQVCRMVGNWALLWGW